jgi:hypothetical protein
MGEPLESKAVEEFGNDGHKTQLVEHTSTEARRRTEAICTQTLR